MARAAGSLSVRLGLTCGILFGSTIYTLGADIASGPPERARIEPASPPSPWTYRFTPYAWITALNGSVTAAGRTADIDASFIDIIEESDSLFALMGYFEARNGPLSLFADLVYTKLGFSAETLRSRELAPGLIGSLGASLGLDVQMLIAEAGAAYEVARWGAGTPISFVAVDAMAGARYWRQKAALELSLVGTINSDGLTIVGNRAIARSGDVDWLDPFVGARIRYQIKPGHELAFSGDIGGFDVGSKLSWQLVGAYSWEFATTRNATWAGVIGYRALYVDYAQGSGLTRYKYDMLQHGPILGISMRF